jgi:hypothetical protein
MIVRLYDTYKDPQPWDQHLPPNLIPPIKHLRKVFEDDHWSYGQITEKLCYHRLHPAEPGDIAKYLDPLERFKRLVGVAASQRLLALLNEGTAPAVFKAFFDL